jgi:transposase
MARRPTPMRHIKDILRLKHQNQLSIREIARSCGIPISTVGDYLQRAQATGLGWPLPEELSDSQLMERLSAPADATEAVVKPLPNWPHIREELGRKSVTLRLLWQEYRQVHSNGYGYSRFCELYERWADTLDPVLRQTHEPGKKLFVDWAGQTVPIHHPDGTLSQASLFVAVLGFSNKLFAEAFAEQQLNSWITGHVHAFEFFGGVTFAVIPDNPKTAVIRADRYEPVLHRTYQEMAEHHGTVILPARPKKPRDKAKVETGVQIAQRQILAALRDLRFFSVGDLNIAIRPLVHKLNAQPFQKLDGSRESWFETAEKAALLPLPEHRYELATWSKAKVNIDYHVAVEKHYYSAPFSLVHKQLDVRLTSRTVEFFLDGKRVAAHVRNHQHGKFTTVAEHRPKAHQRYLEWTPTRLIEWARSVGPQCALVVEQILISKPHPEQGFRSCLGLLRLGKGFGNARLEAAARRALHHQTCSYQSIKSILENRLDQEPEQVELALKSPAHENVRGQTYYH